MLRPPPRTENARMRITLLALLVLLTLACGDERSSTWAQEPHARVDSLLLDMAHDDPAVRRDAATTLGEIWPAAARSVPVLAAALEDDDERVGEAAAASLGRLGAQSLAPLLSFLNEEQDEERRALIASLNSILRLGAKLTPKDLVAFMEMHPRAGLVSLALLSGRWRPGTTRRDDPPITSFLAWYAGPERAETGAIASACTALYGMNALPLSPTRETPEEVLSLLAAEDAAVRSLGAALLAAWGSTHPETVRRVRTAVDEEEGPWGAPIARLLLARLEPESPPQATAEEGPAPEWVVGFANATTSEIVQGLREATVTWEDLLAEADGDLAAVYVRRPVDFHRAVEGRLAAIEALAALGEAAVEAKPLLEQQVADGDELIRYLAARALRRR